MKVLIFFVLISTCSSTTQDSCIKDYDVFTTELKADAPTDVLMSEISRCYFLQPGTHMAPKGYDDLKSYGNYTFIVNHYPVRYLIKDEICLAFVKSNNYLSIPYKKIDGSEEKAEVIGSCEERNGTQHINMHWIEGYENRYILIDLKMANGDKFYVLLEFQYTGETDPELFPDVVDKDASSSLFEVNVTEFLMGADEFINCEVELTLNRQGQMAGNFYSSTLMYYDVTIEAFCSTNMIRMKSIFMVA